MVNALDLEQLAADKLDSVMLSELTPQQRELVELAHHGAIMQKQKLEVLSEHGIDIDLTIDESL